MIIIEEDKSIEVRSEIVRTSKAIKLNIIWTTFFLVPNINVIQMTDPFVMQFEYCKVRSKTFWKNQIADYNMLSQTAASPRLILSSTDRSATQSINYQKKNKPRRCVSTYRIAPPSELEYLGSWPVEICPVMRLWAVQTIYWIR